MIGQCAHGNEPSHHLAYLYAYAGQAWKTQAMVRRLQLEMYTDQPDGLVGNDDCGQMSAWYVLSALGLYAVTPGSTTYVIGSPLFPRATLNLETGRSFVVRAPNAAPGAPYIQSATLNGKPYGRAFLDYADIMAGGELELVMGERPNPAWGAGPGNQPASGEDLMGLD
jgi:predicted alpha-1,2-mannosidase